MDRTFKDSVGQVINPGDLSLNWHRGDYNYEYSGLLIGRVLEEEQWGRYPLMETNVRGQQVRTPIMSGSRSFMLKNATLTNTIIPRRLLDLRSRKEAADVDIFGSELQENDYAYGVDFDGRIGVVSIRHISFFGVESDQLGNSEAGYRYRRYELLIKIHSDEIFGSNLPREWIDSFLEFPNGGFSVKVDR